LHHQLQELLYFILEVEEEVAEPAVDLEVEPFT
jgi:hypothetical protein